MQVRKLDTLRRRDVRQFIHLPFQLYEDCPQWVPPLLPDMRLALDRQRYPFYRHSDADFYLVESEGQALARLVVFEHRPWYTRNRKCGMVSPHSPLHNERRY
jgi:hypothetical protein